MLLQTQTIESSTKIILNYGAIGAMLILCIVALIYMARFFLKQNAVMTAQYREELKVLTLRLDKYVDEDRRKMVEVITNNTIAFNNFSVVLENVKDELHSNKTR